MSLKNSWFYNLISSFCLNHREFGTTNVAEMNNLENLIYLQRNKN